MISPNEAKRERDRRYSARKHGTPAVTIDMRRYSRRELAEEGARYPEPVTGRPKTRGECASVPRPCVFCSCRYNLFLDVSVNHSIKLNFPDKEPGDMAESCALDCADRGGATLEEVGVVTNLVRERVRQVEFVALRKLVRSGVLGEYVDGETRRVAER